MIPKDKVQDIIARHDNLEKELSSGNIDPKLFAKKSKEYSGLGAIITIAREYLKFDNEKSDLENIIKDKKNDTEIAEMAQKDLNDLKLKKDAIVEIRAGTGGLEASLFCSDLFKMYEKVCSKKKWNLEIISISKSEAGVLKKLFSLLVVVIFILI